MHPALSVIFFTTLSGAGYGLLTWCALAALAQALPRQATADIGGVGAGAGDDRAAQLAWSPRQAAARVAGVLAMAQFVAVARGRGLGADLRAGRAGRRRAAARDAGAGAAGLDCRADRVGHAGLHRTDRRRGRDGGLHGDDLRLAQADSRLAASAGGAGVSVVRIADRRPAAGGGGIAVGCFDRQPAGDGGGRVGHRLVGTQAPLLAGHRHHAAAGHPWRCSRDARARGQGVRASPHRGQLPHPRDGVRGGAQACATSCGRWRWCCSRWCRSC